MLCSKLDPPREPYDSKTCFKTPKPIVAMNVSQGYPVNEGGTHPALYYREGYMHHGAAGTAAMGYEGLDTRYNPSAMSYYARSGSASGGVNIAGVTPSYAGYPTVSQQGPSSERFSFPGCHVPQAVGARPRSHPSQVATANPPRAGYGGHNAMPWYGGAPRTYPIPQEHMYNMYHYNRHDYEDSKAACKMINGREARNRAEKNRRDKLNGSIQDLSGMVNHVADSPRRVDKTAVLRFSAHALRLNYVFGRSRPNVSAIMSQNVQNVLFEMLNCFMLTLTCRGQIVLVSPSVEQFLGHCQTDLFGLSLLNLVHPDDQDTLRRQLVPTNLANLFESSASLSTAPPSTAEEARKRSQEEEEEIDRRLSRDRRRFFIRIARAGPRTEPTIYELVIIEGSFRRADFAPRGEQSTSPSGHQLMRRSRGRDDGITLHNINGNDIVLIATARVIEVPNICDRLMEACKYEYKTRHLIDGRIVQCDHRISVVAGYMTTEVSGLSPFTFMHKDDVRWVIVALRQMYDYNQKDGESCYRLMTRTGDFVYLKTRGYLEVDSATNVVQSFVCVNTLVSEEEGRELVREMKRKFSVIFNQDELPVESDEAAVENPLQIERAVMNLITNLHPEEDDPDDAVFPSPMSNASSNASSSASGNTQQLAIIAPKISQVKSAIEKSMSVIGIAAKGASSGENESASQQGPSTSKGNQPGGASVQRPTVLQKVQSPSAAPESRVPPLPTSEHYFTQPFSPPSSSSSSSNSSMLSPASQYQTQRNSRSPYGGSIPPTSPPAIASTSASCSRNLEHTAIGYTRTTSVLKRTYSRSTGGCGVDETTNTESYTESKRYKIIPSDLSACLRKLVNPSSDLTAMLPSAFDVVDQSLVTTESMTALMRGQEEQQEQREIFQSIQHEYTYGVQSNDTGGVNEPNAESILGNLFEGDVVLATDSAATGAGLDVIDDSAGVVSNVETLGGVIAEEPLSQINPAELSTTTTIASVITSSRSTGTGASFSGDNDSKSS
ncbi:uncharacterized protein LOC129764676 isoform X2 [Toxorhynchites rutilus septentrionalis]|uniref:uncharacterized protein LOC129764676 isoform X2 n=1 Tax=Toxorhynchites rutilus septentrionalis TaxID=329112 RepID=UPI00247AC8C6|nr:uncharacterized protein LOC129764676 isoform X2 [Toxorhynchites rutilus septentrionalis]